MLLFVRPPEPQKFAKAVTKSKQAVEQHIDALLKAAAQQDAGGAVAALLDTPVTKEKKKKKNIFQPKWKDYKDAFSKAQHGKCAYCEVSVIGAQHGDVEHYYPKAALAALYDDPSTWGEEKPYLSSVIGRKTKPLCGIGYWWLAYEWSNYLLSCMVCNEYWKGTIFPVEDDPRKLPPASDASEIALLLNPFDDINPAEHLCFDMFGQIHPMKDSRRGFETIRTCGLDRPSLRGIRADIAREVYYLVNKLYKAETPTEVKDALFSLYLKGVETNQHPGMVRIILEHRSGLTWIDLIEQLASRLTNDLLDATEPDEIKDALCALYEMGNESRENFGLVQKIVAEQSGKNWETIVRELASSLTELYNASREVDVRMCALQFLHEMCSESHSHSQIVRSLVESECGLSWNELELEVWAVRNI